DRPLGARDPRSLHDRHRRIHLRIGRRSRRLRLHFRVGADERAFEGNRRSEARGARPHARRAPALRHGAGRRRLEVGMKPARIGQWFDAAGVVAAMLLAVLVNVYAARHYRRWDLTTHGLYTLSPATLETLHSLNEQVEVDVLLSSRDPLANSVKF